MCHCQVKLKFGTQVPLTWSVNFVRIQVMLGWDPAPPTYIKKVVCGYPPFAGYGLLTEEAVTFYVIHQAFTMIRSQFPQ